MVMSSNLAAGLSGNCDQATASWSAINHRSAMLSRRSLKANTSPPLNRAAPSTTTMPSLHSPRPVPSKYQFVLPASSAKTSPTSPLPFPASLTNNTKTSRVADIHSYRPHGGSPDDSLVLPPPPKWDWRTTGNTPLVKNQGATCASCWVNSALAAVESSLSIKYNVSAFNIGPFSRQVIIDCANSDNFGQDYARDTGCDGGGAADAMFFMHQFTIATEAAYTYTSGLTGTWSAANCNISALSLPLRDGTWMQAGTPIIYTLNHGTKNEPYLQAAVALQPVVINWNMGGNFNSFADGLYSISLQNDNVNGCMNDPNYTNHQM